MAGMKEIRVKIKSVQNTRKITKAMEMVAASKMRKAQERMRAARPYGDTVRVIAGHLRQANPEYTHPFLIKREPIKRVSGSRNINVLPPVERDDGEKGNCWQLTSCRSGWRWIVAHAAEISAACDEADKADAMAIARELAEKLRKKAEKEAAAPK